MLKTSTAATVRVALSMMVLQMGFASMARAQDHSGRVVTVRLHADGAAGALEAWTPAGCSRTWRSTERKLRRLAEHDVRVGVDPGSDRSTLDAAPRSLSIFAAVAPDSDVNDGDVDDGDVDGGGVATRKPWLRVPLGLDAQVLVRAAADGRLNLEVAQELMVACATAHEEGASAAGIRRVRALQERLPECSIPWVLELAAGDPDRAETGRGPAAAGPEVVPRELLERALAALNGSTESSAAFLLRALKRDPTVLESVAVTRTLRRILRTTRRDTPSVAELGFHLAIVRQDVASARRWTFVWLEYVRGDVEALRRIGLRLAVLPASKSLDEVRRLCFELALQADPRDSRMLREAFGFFAGVDNDRLLGDARIRDLATMRRVGMRLIASLEGDARALNSFAWRLLTEEPWMGQSQALALAAVRRMQAVDGWDTHWRMDTVALAEFECGHLMAAVDLQERAVMACDPGVRPRYQQRLARYRTAWLAAGGPAAKPGGAGPRAATPSGN